MKSWFATSGDGKTSETMASVFKRGGKKNRGGSYYVSWTDHSGQRQTKSAKTTDKATAERIGAKLEADAALRRDGVIDPTLDAIGKESQRSIESHLADYEAKLRAANRHPRYIRDSLTVVRALAEFCEIVSVADLDADGVNHYVGALQAKGRSAGTVHFHLSIIKALSRWLTINHKLARDPLISVRKPNPDADRRRERRMLLPDEWHWLRDATKTGPDRFGMTGSERVLLYATAIQTGLRSNELRSLTRGRMFLDSQPPFITCKARSTKNKKDARQYIRSDVAADLRLHLATKATKASVFGMPHETDVATMVRADLAEARQMWLEPVKRDAEDYMRREQSDFLNATNHEGEIFDFHALRHTCGAWLAIAGVHPKAIQTVMRHSTITLTMDTYGHLFPGQEADTVARFPDMLNCKSNALLATGTDDAEVKTDQRRAAHAQRAGRETAQSGASECDGQSTPTAQEKSPKPLQIADLDDDVRDDATESENRAGRTRTYNQQIMSLLL